MSKEQLGAMEALTRLDQEILYVAYKPKHEQMARDLATVRTAIATMGDELVLLAKLGHPEAQFFNPLEVFAAERIRDRILAVSKTTGEHAGT